MLTTNLTKELLAAHHDMLLRNMQYLDTYFCWILSAAAAKINSVIHENKCASPMPRISHPLTQPTVVLTHCTHRRVCAAC
eukprot:6180316-Pleurochrysis_carterae.AAC.5